MQSQQRCERFWQVPLQNRTVYFSLPTVLQLRTGVWSPLPSRCWWVDSSAPFFHPMSRVCGHRSADTAGHQRVPLPGEPINILQLEHQTQNHSKSKNQTPNLTFSITNASNSIRLSHAVGECVFAYTLAYTVCKGQGRQRGFTTSLVSSAEQHVWLIMIRSLSKEQNELKVDCR